MTEKRLDVNSIDDLFIRNELIRLYEENGQLKFALIQEQEVSKELKSQLDTMIDIFNDSGLDYHISDELNEILNR